MIPSIFEYLPRHARALFEKVAETSVRETNPEIVAPDLPAEPRVESPPPHPYTVGLKQLLPIGAGLATGYAAGQGAPRLYDLIKGTAASKRLPYNTLGAISGVAGGIGGLAATIMNQSTQAEMDRANQEYKDYLARRAGGSAGPTVQPPPVRT